MFAKSPAHVRLERLCDARVELPEDVEYEGQYLRWADSSIVMYNNGVGPKSLLNKYHSVFKKTSWYFIRTYSPKTDAVIIHYVIYLPSHPYPSINNLSLPSHPCHNIQNALTTHPPIPLVHPWEEETMRRRTPAPTNEIEVVIRNLFYSLHMITHIKTNILRYRYHICHEGLHVCIIPHHSHTKLHFLDM